MISISYYHNPDRPNNVCISIGRNLHIYFSYETVIAFEEDGDLYCCENTWGPTTGKHLNSIQPNHSLRMSYDVFQQRFNETMSKYGKIVPFVSHSY